MERIQQQKEEKKANMIRTALPASNSSLVHLSASHSLSLHPASNLVLEAQAQAAHSAGHSEDSSVIRPRRHSLIPPKHAHSSMPSNEPIRSYASVWRD